MIKQVLSSALVLSLPLFVSVPALSQPLTFVGDTNDGTEFFIDESTLAYKSEFDSVHAWVYAGNRNMRQIPGHIIFISCSSNESVIIGDVLSTSDGELISLNMYKESQIEANSFENGSFLAHIRNGECP